MEFFKVRFIYDSNDIGRTVWVEEIKLFDAETAEELNNKIDTYIKGPFKEYRSRMKMTDVQKL